MEKSPRRSSPRRSSLRETKGSPVRPDSWKAKLYRHKFLTLASVAAAIILLGVALGIGLGVGLNQDSHSSSSKAREDHVSSPTVSSSQCANNASTALPSSTRNVTSRALLEPPATWKPTVGMTWQIVLLNPIMPTVPMQPIVSVYDIDMFGNPASTMAALHAQGVKVICYFSAGSFENWRPDAGAFLKSDLGHDLNGWPGEIWINTESPNVRKIMAARIAMARDKGCDAIDPDNVDGWETNTGFPLTSATALDYLKFISTTAAKHSLATGLKNAGDLAANTSSFLDFAVVESCVGQNQCEIYQPFIAAGKPVFEIEYPPGAPGYVTVTNMARSCKLTGNLGFSEVMKGKYLDGWVEYCDGLVAVTPVW